MPRRRWEREYLDEVIDLPWREFLDACAGIPDAEMLDPGVVEGWCVKDVIAHVAVWDDEAVKNLPFIVEGQRLPRYGGVDNFNARQFASISQLGLAEARERSRVSHQRLLAYLDGVEPSWYERESRFRHRLRLDTWRHYPEHTQAVLAWRRARAL